MAYKTKYTLFIEDMQKRIPGILNDFYYESNNYRYYKAKIFRPEYSFWYHYNECFEIELFPENFNSREMKVDRWNIVLWQNLFGCDAWIVLKHELLYSEYDILKTVEKYKKYIQNLED